VVLGYFQGKTHHEAARLLGCATGTIASRLARARARLRGLLERRGITATMATVAVALSEHGAQAASAGKVVAATARAIQAMGSAYHGQEVSPAAVGLSEAVLRAMAWARLISLVAFVGGFALCALGLAGVVMAAAGTSNSPATVQQVSGGKTPEQA